MITRRVSLIQGPPGPPGTLSVAPVSWTPGVIANGSFAKHVCVATGAIVGLPVLPPVWSVVLPDGVFLYGVVTAADQVTVYMVNMSGSSQTVAAGQVFFEVLTQ